MVNLPLVPSPLNSMSSIIPLNILVVGEISKSDLIKTSSFRLKVSWCLPNGLSKVVLKDEVELNSDMFLSIVICLVSEKSTELTVKVVFITIVLSSLN